MAVQFLANKEFLIFKAESTAGTAVTPSATDFDVIFEVIKPDNALEMDSSKKLALPGYSNYNDTPGAQGFNISAQCKLRSGTAVNAMPKMGKVLKALGLVGAVEGTDKGYSFSSEPSGDSQTYTAWYVRCSAGAAPVGVCHKVAGLMGAGKIGADGAGKDIMVSGEFKGKYDGSVDLDNAALVALAVLTAPDTAPSVKLQNATLSIGGTAHKISKFELDFGCDLQPDLDTADGTCYEAFTIVNREAKLSINPLIKTVALYDAYDTMIDSGMDGATVKLAITGTIPWSITLPNAQLISAKDSPREGKGSWDMSFKAMRNGTDASLKVADMNVDCQFEILQGAKS